MNARLLARLSRERPEAGETLIEVLIASALMAILALAVVGGLATVLISSRIHRNQADGNVSLVEAMEKVRAPETALSCAFNDASHPYRTGLPAGVTISSIEYQTTGADGGGKSILVWSPSNSVCDLSSPLSLQRITLQYVNADSSVNPSLSFVKGKF